MSNIRHEDFAGSNREHDKTSLENYGTAVGVANQHIPTNSGLTHQEHTIADNARWHEQQRQEEERRRNGG